MSTCHAVGPCAGVASGCIPAQLSIAAGDWMRAAGYNRTPPPPPIPLSTPVPYPLLTEQPPTPPIYSPHRVVSCLRYLGFTAQAESIPATSEVVQLQANTLIRREGLACLTVYIIKATTSLSYAQ